MKPGWKTSEFWATIVLNIAVVATALAGSVPAKYAAAVTTIATVGYAISRGLAKKTA
jgi:hypothetical protein